MKRVTLACLALVMLVVTPTTAQTYATEKYVARVDAERIALGPDESRTVGLHLHAETRCEGTASQPAEFFLARSHGTSAGPAFRYRVRGRNLTPAQDVITLEWSRSDQDPLLYVADARLDLNVTRELPGTDGTEIEQYLRPRIHGGDGGPFCITEGLGGPYIDYEVFDIQAPEGSEPAGGAAPSTPGPGPLSAGISLVAAAVVAGLRRRQRT